MSVPNISHQQRRHTLRLLRNLLVLAVGLGLLADHYGVPHVLVNYTHDQHHGTRHYQSCRYWSVTGAREDSPGRFGEGCPALVFLPLDKPMTHHVENWARSLWTRLQSLIP